MNSMSRVIKITPSELVKAWNDTLPRILNAGDSVSIQLDEGRDNGLRIHIKTEGHSEYSFDFSCYYVDDREVKVKLVDVERAGNHVDEHTEIIQSLIRDYVRHIHECAQNIQQITHS